MNNNENIPSIETTKFNDTTVLADPSKIVTSLLFVVIGTVLLVIGYLQSENSQNLCAALIAIGGITALFGLIKLVVKSKTLVYTPTKSKIAARDLLFDIESKSIVKALAEGGDTSKASTLNQNHNGSLRLDTLKSRDGKFVAMQLMSYSSYVFQPESEVKIFTGTDAQRIANVIDSIKD